MQAAPVRRSGGCGEAQSRELDRDLVVEEAAAVEEKLPQYGSLWVRGPRPLGDGSLDIHRLQNARTVYETNRRQANGRAGVRPLIFAVSELGAAGTKRGNRQREIGEIPAAVDVEISLSALTHECRDERLSVDKIEHAVARLIGWAGLGEPR